MKKILILIILIILISISIFCFTACNMTLVGNYNFTKVHIYYEGYEECLEIKSWTDGDTGIEVDSKKYGSLFISEGHYLMCEDDCPICLNKRNTEE